MSKVRSMAAVRSVEAYDYCANIGQQFDNVKHMKSFIEGFARWLQQGC